VVKRPSSDVSSGLPAFAPPPIPAWAKADFSEQLCCTRVDDSSQRTWGTPSDSWSRHVEKKSRGRKPRRQSHELHDDRVRPRNGSHGDSGSWFGRRVRFYRGTTRWRTYG